MRCLMQSKSVLPPRPVLLNNSYKSSPLAPEQCSSGEHQGRLLSEDRKMFGLILNASLVALAAGAAFHQPGPSSGCDIPPGKSPGLHGLQDFLLVHQVYKSFALVHQVFRLFLPRQINIYFFFVKFQFLRHSLIPNNA